VTAVCESLSELLSRGLNRSRKTRIALALIIGLSFAALTMLRPAMLAPGATPDQSSVSSEISGTPTPTKHTHRIGDFPAFYAAATIVSDGRIKDLYDFELQKQTQASIPELKDSAFSGKFLAFAYPPWFAICISPLALLPFFWSKTLWMVLMFGCAYGSARLLSKHFQQPFLWVLVTLLGFGPFFSATLGGQNASLSLFLLLASLYSKNSFLRGASLGLAFFKPQFAGIVLLSQMIFWLSSRKSASRLTVNREYLAGLALLLVLFGLASILFIGPSFLSEWLQATQVFSKEEKLANGHLSVSLFGLVNNLLSGAGSGALAENLQGAVKVGLLIITGFLGIVGIRKGLKETPLLLAMLLSPHTVFYDSSLMLPSIVRFFSNLWLLPVVLVCSSIILILKGEEFFGLAYCGLFSLFALALLGLTAWLKSTKPDSTD